MNRAIKGTVILGVVAAVLFTMVGCSKLQESLDVVGKESIISFDAVLKAIPDKVEADEMNAGWSLSAPDDSVRFIWSADYSIAPLHDVMLELDAQPFLDAGLAPEKLPDEYAYYEGDVMGGMGGKILMVGVKLGDDKLTYSGSPTALTAFEQIVSNYRSSISYHTQLDHYGVNLGNGNMFEWAKDMSTNDKDIVFVLEPAALIAAGVDPEAVEGWLFAKVTVDIDGKPTEVDKFLKPFDLK